MTMPTFTDIGVSQEGHVGIVEIQRPPHNFFDISLINQIADAFDAIDADDSYRAIVLAAQGKAFCAGANFGDGQDQAPAGAPQFSAGISRPNNLYIEAVRLFRNKKPVVGAIQGAAIGGGLGLAMMPDFRVGCPESRFAANFTRLGFHHGFGLTVTLPEVIGTHKANLLFLTGRRIKGEEALQMGLVDVLVPQDELRGAAIALAAEIAENSPLGTESTRLTMRGGLADRVREATDHELQEQTRLRATEDFREGVKAMAERRVPNFQKK